MNRGAPLGPASPHSVHTSKWESCPGDVHLESSAVNGVEVLWMGLRVDHCLWRDQVGGTDAGSDHGGSSTTRRASSK
jgi:hypothetical protein